MSRLTVGMRVWRHRTAHRSHYTWDPYIVASVGRKWATLMAGYGRPARVAIEMDRGFYRLDNPPYGSEAVYTDDQLVEREQRAALLDVRRKAAAALDSATPETILTICRLLNIDTPDALPSEAEVLARFGALPLTSDRSIE